MKRLQSIFLQGLVTFLPIALTIYLVYAGITIVDNIFGRFLRDLLPVYIPGLGILLTVLIIFLLGLLLNNLITGGVFKALESQLTKVPFIKAIYNPLRDLMNLFNKGGGPQALKTVVLVDLNDSGIRAMGLVTRDTFADVPAIEKHATQKVAVYIPLSYGLGGFTLLVDKSRITQVDIPVEKAMGLAITGWVKVDSSKESGGNSSGQ
ncbi:MAG: DUF502 domain-containing protein [Bdellovibrionia bacterium]